MYLPLREHTTFEIEYTEAGLQRIRKTPLQFFIWPGANSDRDLTGRFLYKMAFANRRTVAGLFVVNERGDADHRRLFTKTGNDLYLPNDPSLTAQTRIQFQKVG